MRTPRCVDAGDAATARKLAHKYRCLIADAERAGEAERVQRWQTLQAHQATLASTSAVRQLLLSAGTRYAL